ncbi:MAG: 5'-3' exonuclease H3TH domain-containing protein [Halioglobus sp.]
MGKERVCLIDSSIYIFRAWFSMPDQWHNEDGWPLNAVYGYGRFLLEFLEKERPAHCAAAFDESLGTCFRNDILPSYKSSRELPDETLAFQLNACRELTETLGIPCYGGPRYEADDYLATLGRLYRERGIAVSILTRDKDLGPILQNPDDLWWDYAGGVSLDTSAFSEKFGVEPRQFADYLALVGDPIDDIPGVPGVGAKTAAKLLQQFGDLQRLADEMENVGSSSIRGAARVQANLTDYWSQVLLARQLTGLEEYIPTLTETRGFSLTVESLDRAEAYLTELGLSGPLTRRCKALRKSISK